MTSVAHPDLARADDCLAAPNSPAPKGSHWYYHLNRATQQKCWYVRSVERQPQDVTVQTSSPNAAMLPTNVGQIRSTRPRDSSGSARQPEPVIAATEEPASSNAPTVQVAAAGPETPLSEANPRLTAPTTIWPDPPPVQPLVKAEDAGATTASPDPAYSVADASDSVFRKDERTGAFDIPIGLFPAFAFGLVVFGFGLRFLMKQTAARRAQQADCTEGVTPPIGDHASPAGIGLADEPTVISKDDLETFVSAMSGDEPLERIIRFAHPENDIGAREAKLAQLREDIGQRLGWIEPQQPHSSRQTLAS